MSEMKIGFEMRRVRIALADILPVRHVKDPQDNIKRYRTIRASIKEVGLIEPLVVYPQKGAPGKYLLLDGHLRHYALKDLGRTEAECIIASDDESFTYNARVNRLNPIAEHKMIMKAVNNGVKPEKIAAALNLSEADVKASMTLLDGINEEAADLLKDKAVSPKAIRLMRKVSGVRQIEIAELMVSAGNYTKGYAEALVLGDTEGPVGQPGRAEAEEGHDAGGDWQTGGGDGNAGAGFEGSGTELWRQHAEPDAGPRVCQKAARQGEGGPIPEREPSRHLH
jgi:ParB/RepB/Spo0J family partition protein